jgi:S1-C subfamily serine protease
VDPLHDLALLQGPVGRLALPIRIASPIWLGEAIMAAGYPLMDVLGADLKVTTGNISGLTGSHGDISRFQFSAPIGSGSSGGAIIDEDGNLVGITAASLAHQNFRDRGSISENVNFGVRAAMVYELIAAAACRSFNHGPCQRQSPRCNQPVAQFGRLDPCFRVNHQSCRCIQVG